MTNEKDLGNESFKKMNYRQAIDHYNRYVQEEHGDNKNAFFNLSLCYSKLGRSGESVEAAERAVEIDQNYSKCYYRLAHQYQKLKGREYAVFINAVRFMRLAGQEQQDERRQMQQLTNQYRRQFASKSPKSQQIKDIQGIIECSQSMVVHNQVREEVDKYIEEWVYEWGEGTQDEEAKWLEIEYITEEIDYQLGINLAYFYVNQIRNTQTKKVVQRQIVELKNRLQKEYQVNFKDIGIDPNQTNPNQKEDTDSQQNLFAEEETPKKQVQEKVATHQKDTVKSSNVKAEVQKVKSGQKKKPSLVEKLEQKRRKKDQMEVEVDKKQSIKEKLKTKVLPQEVKIVTKVQSIPKNKPETLLIKKNFQIDIESLYQKQCDSLTNCKDIFTTTFQCVIKILESKRIDPQTKGLLFVQMRKRVKKFKRIMEATSQNQQIIVFDLLKKNNMEEYAIDLAPKHHSV